MARRLAQLLTIGLLAILIVGCGGESTSTPRGAANTGANAAGANAGNANAGGANAGGATATSNASGGGIRSDACPITTPPAMPISSPPTEMGCYEGVDGSWRAVPCVCDLWVDSPRATDLKVAFTFSFLPTRMASSLGGDIKAQVEFPDAAANWFDTWQQQAQRDPGFEVSHSNEDGTTIVLMRQTDVTLVAVPLAGCESRRPRASINGPWGTELRIEMVATLTDQDGDTVTTITNDCDQPAARPTPFSGSAGGAGGAPQ